VLEEMRALSPRPYRYGSHLALADFPRSDQFGVQAASVVSNEMAGLDRPAKMRAFDTLPMPGVRGAVARAEDHGYEVAPGRLMGSLHTEHQVRWLEGVIVWSLADPSERPSLDGGALERPDERSAWRATVTGEDAGLTIDATGHPLRQHALLFAIRVPAPARLSVDAGSAGGPWEPAVTIALARDGSYLGFVALDDRPRTIDAVRVLVSGVPTFELFDLVLVAFG
jgi:hypothetical protein